MGKLYVYSTLASDVNYTNHAEGGADMPIALPAVHVKGGAGVANDRIITPQGVVTEITEEQAEYLEANPVFQLHKKNGFVQVSSALVDPEKAAADMTRQDNSAPMTNADVPKDTEVSGESVSDVAVPKGRKR